MAKYPSEHTYALKYFRAFLDSWLDKNGLNKTVAAQRLGVGQSQLNEILNGKRGASINVLEKMCSNLRVNIVDALSLGRRLCGDGSDDIVLSRDDIETIEAFKTVLKNQNDSAAKLIVKNVLAYANDEKESQNNGTVHALKNNK